MARKNSDTRQNILGPQMLKGNQARFFKSILTVVMISCIKIFLNPLD